MKELPANIFKPSESSSVRSRVIFHANGNADVWIKCHRGVLSFNDKVVLQNGDELSDKRLYAVCSKAYKGTISFYRCIMFNTPASESYNLTQNSVQIIHCIQRHHWIAASNIGCPHNSVNIHDSLYYDLDAATYQIVKNMFGGDECEVHISEEGTSTTRCKRLWNICHCFYHLNCS